MSNWDEMVLVGRVARAHGNRGQVIVDPATDFPEERFKAGSVLHIRRGDTTELMTVENVRFHRGRPIVGLAGIDTMNAAEALAGTELRVGVDALQPLPARSYTTTISSVHSRDATRRDDREREKRRRDGQVAGSSWSKRTATC